MGLIVQKFGGSSVADAKRVFNVADIAVCVGCGLLILNVLFFDKKDKKEKVNGKKDSELRN